MTFMKKILDALNLEKRNIPLPSIEDESICNPDIDDKPLSTLPEPEPEPEPILNPLPDLSTITFDDTDKPYTSSRLLIHGLHLYFIDVAREIVSHKRISLIPLMREYHLSEDEVKEIISEMTDAGILDADQNINMNSNELEHFFDIYEPSLFDCPHTVFDKEIFLCIGEILFESGVESLYDSMKPDEVLDYLNIMERMNIIQYDNYENSYQILIPKEEFELKSNNIPASFSSELFNIQKYAPLDKNSRMSGAEFERYCAFLLSKNNFENVKITPQSGDHGIDLLAEKDDISYAIQCKCYSCSVGNSAIQQAHTGKELYKKDIGVVLTNSSFTKQAIAEAEALGIKLWDCVKLEEFEKRL